MPLSMIKPYILHYLSVTNRTKLQRIQVVLIDVVETVHQTTIIHAMSNPEHMTNFMNHCSHRRIENFRPIDLRLLTTCKFIVPSQKWKNTHSCLVLSPTVHEIPTISRINVFKSNPHDTISIFGYPLLHIGQNILSQILTSIVILPFFYSLQLLFKLQHRQCFHFHFGIKHWTKAT